MTRDKSSSALQVQQLIEQAKSVRPVPQATRARVLRRAQSSALLGASFYASKAPWRRTASAVTWLGGAALAVGLASAGVALHLRALRLPASDHAKSAASSASAVALGARLAPAASVSVFPGAVEVAAPAASTAEAAHVPRAVSPLESDAAELALMRRAHEAYGNHDFAAALRLLAEHGRRFPSGRLAEEREALRVRALSGSGRNEAARVAAHSFAIHFPQSVLSRTMAAADAGE
jgi:hypothetical protein